MELRFCFSEMAPFPQSKVLFLAEVCVFFNFYFGKKYEKVTEIAQRPRILVT